MKKSRSGFTLVELVTVIAVLAALMALLFPALQSATGKARDAAARDLCSQIASSWQILLQEANRYPSADLIRREIDTGYDSGESNGDLYFQMSPGVTSLLNWWEPISPVPSGDRKQYNPKYRFGSRKGQTVSHSGNDRFVNTDAWPPDIRLERQDVQKQFGMMAPWAGNKFVNEDGNPLTSFEPSYIQDKGKKSNATEHAWGYGIVWVILDTNADGKVTIPGKFTEDGQELELPASSHAWVFNEDRDRIIHSW